MSFERFWCSMYLKVVVVLILGHGIFGAIVVRLIWFLHNIVVRLIVLKMLRRR